MSKSGRSDYAAALSKRGKRMIAIIVVAVLLLGIVGGIASATVISVPAGFGSTLIDPFAGTVRPGPLGPSFAIGAKAPWVEVIVIKVAVDRVYMWTELGPEGRIQAGGALSGEPDELNAPAVLSRDGLQIIVDLNVRWTLDQQRLSQLYVNYPEFNWRDATIIPIIREAVRDLIVRFDAIEAYSKRGELSVPLREAIETQLAEEQSLNNAIRLEDVELLDIQLPSTVRLAIENKQASLQFIETASNERQAALIRADAQKQAAVIQATGLAEAKVIEANGTRIAINTAVEALGGDRADAARLFFQLTQLQKISESGSNVIVMVGQNEAGQFFLIPLDKDDEPTT